MPADDVIALRASAHPEGEAGVEDAQIAHVDAVKPGRQSRIEEEALRVEVRLHTEQRAQAEEHHARGPGLRDARHEVIRRTRREPQIALEPAPELWQPVRRKATAGLDERTRDLGGLFAQAVSRESLRDQRVVVGPNRTVVVAPRV